MLLLIPQIEKQKYGFNIVAVHVLEELSAQVECTRLMPKTYLYIDPNKRTVHSTFYF